MAKVSRLSGSNLDVIIIATYVYFVSFMAQLDDTVQAAFTRETIFSAIGLAEGGFCPVTIRPLVCTFT